MILQSDMSVLVEVDHPEFEEIRSILSGFSELEKSPEHIHTYRITPISIWNAASAGVPLSEIFSFLEQWSKFDLPQNVRFQVEDLYNRYGRLTLRAEDDRMELRADDQLIIEEALANKRIAPFLVKRLDPQCVVINPHFRGYLKKEFIDIGYPVRDEAGYVEGAPLSVQLRDETLEGKPFALREYQRSAVEAFWEQGSNTGGSGVIVLPCGAGKTMVGMAVMEKYQCHTLILTTNIIALRQWKQELLDKSELTEDDVGEFSGERKEVRPVTLATYNIITYRRDKEHDFEHFNLFLDNNWGLIIYDEVHLLPAPVFRVTAELQARRRLGLTATLVREDGLETDVFSLIGPKKYDVPWKVLENANWIASAACKEIRVDMTRDLRMSYITANEREKFRIASENARKLEVVASLLNHHPQDRVLVIGQFLDQLELLSKRFNLPLITGSTPTARRQELYQQFRDGEVRVLAVSKVANFSIDLPDANVAIQISGTFGSRQEEAQRLGRILRPKEGNNTAWFYTVVTRGSKEQQFAANRQLFLTEQGYSYTLENWDD